MNTTLKLKAKNLQQLLNALRSDGYTTIAPTIHDGAIVYDRVDSIDMLPIGWSDEQEPASYRLKKHKDETYFDFGPAPQSWKRFLYPPMKKLFSIVRNGKSLTAVPEKDPTMKYAFIGVRACELSAILIQDKILVDGPYADNAYTDARKNLFTVAINCTRPGGTCFCASMKSGPKVKSGFDLALTEMSAGKEHYFIMQVGTELGSRIAGMVETTPATDEEVGAADALIMRAESEMKKSVETEGLQALLSENLDHPQFDNVAGRCLLCGNCTLVCPTCFCSTIEDSTDLFGHVATRTRRWDSCFTMDFAKVAGGNYRISPKSRYRQWLTHKFSTWVGQYGMFGCVGCGRCITWCPVGIDVTAEIRSIRGAQTQQRKGD
ncbi:MAG TPA: 4Fe-4S dicluster domain-containing protein [Candidatus Kryptonia bacterium]